jgi:2-iminobutanoate/2-iminopropanoate deaminase
MKKFLLCVATCLLACQGLQAVSYSQSVKAGRYLFVSGQLPIDPQTGTIVEGDIAPLTNLVLDNLQQVLQSQGYAMSHVSKTVVYLRDIRDYDQMDAAYAARFPFSIPPARDVVVAENLLSNARIEIECIAFK